MRLKDVFQMESELHSTAKLKVIVVQAPPFLVQVLLSCTRRKRANFLSVNAGGFVDDVRCLCSLIAGRILTSIFCASSEGLKLDLMTTFTSSLVRPTSLTRGMTRKGRMMSLVVRYLHGGGRQGVCKSVRVRKCVCVAGIHDNLAP